MRWSKLGSGWGGGVDLVPRCSLVVSSVTSTIKDDLVGVKHLITNGLTHSCRSRLSK